jgi:hypothetical protein
VPARLALSAASLVEELGEAPHAHAGDSWRSGTTGLLRRRFDGSRREMRFGRIVALSVTTFVARPGAGPVGGLPLDPLQSKGKPSPPAVQRPLPVASAASPAIPELVGDRPGVN